MVAKEEVVSKVTDCLVEALGLDAEEVTLNASLTKDLGSESIDFLDIVFRLEKSFGLKIPRGDLFPENIFNNEKFVQNGRLTPDGLTELKHRLPYINLTEFSKNPNVREVADLLTVGMIVNYIDSKLNPQWK